MKPEKFRKICRKYFTDTNFTMETDFNGTSTISIYYVGFGVMRYCWQDEEKPYLLLADKFRYNENFSKVQPCRNDGTFIGCWLDYKKLYHVGRNQLIKIILNMIESIKIAKVNYKKHLIEKDFV